MKLEQMKDLIYNNIPDDGYQVLNCSVFYKAMKEHESIFDAAFDQLISEKRIRLDCGAALKIIKVI
jgi:hypothetical protein